MSTSWLRGYTGALCLVAGCSRAAAPHSATTAATAIAREPGAASSASDLATSLRVRTEDAPNRAAAAAPEALGFPHRPDGCAHEAHAPLPFHERAERHLARFGPQPAVRNLHLGFVGDPARSVVVQWSTDEGTLASEVQFGEAPDALARSAQGYSFTYRGAPGRRQHEVHLCGLDPRRRYYYAVTTERGPARVASFVTAPEGPSAVRIMVAGDSRTHAEVWGRLSQQALALRPDVIFFTGDVVEAGEAQPQWDTFFTNGAELLAAVPAYVADGNHDNPSPVFYAQFALPPNGAAEHNERWYDAVYGPVHLFVLDDSTIAPSVIAGPETAFLRRALQRIDRTRTPWAIAMHHKPLYTTAVGHLPELFTRRLWEPLMDAANLDVDLAGHVHNYESLYPMRAGRLVGEGHGTTRLTFGGAGAPLYRFRPRQPISRTRESVYGFAMLDVDASSMRWTAYRIDGTVIESLSLSPNVGPPP